MNKQLSIIEDLDYNTIISRDLFDKKVEEIVQEISQYVLDNIDSMEDCSSFNDELEMNLYDCIKIVDAKKITLADLPESMSLKNARLLIEENEENCTFARKNKIFLCRLIRRAVTNVIRDRLKKDNLSLIDEKLEEFWLFLTT